MQQVPILIGASVFSASQGFHLPSASVIQSTLK